jgi:hypothetical protein
MVRSSVLLVSRSGRQNAPGTLPFPSHFGTTVIAFHQSSGEHIRPVGLPPAVREKRTGGATHGFRQTATIDLPARPRKHLSRTFETGIT